MKERLESEGKMREGGTSGGRKRDTIICFQKYRMRSTRSNVAKQLHQPSYLYESKQCLERESDLLTVTDRIKAHN